MKISDLLYIRDKIRNAHNLSNINADLAQLKYDITNVVNSIANPEYRDLVVEILKELDAIDVALSTSTSKLTQLLDKVKDEVAEKEIPFFGENYKLEIKHNAVESIRTQRVMYTKDTITSEVLDKINLYTNWQYPALEIGCRDGQWTQHMVAADPLYVVDYYRDFIDSTLEKFNPEYQLRLRPYLLKEPADMLAELPLGQFGFVFCWNFMNYASFDTVKEYLKIVRELLRPGGTFMFSYNDGDRPAGAALAESYFMTYVPKHMLVPLCESLGFIITEQRTRDTSVSWIEIRKPGELTTIKAHQVLGEITPREN